MAEPKEPIDIEQGYITLTELYIILDTLHGSLKVADSAQIWNFSREQRLKLINTFFNRFQTVKISISEEAQ